jgi:hypothetical protein
MYILIKMTLYGKAVNYKVLSSSSITLINLFLGQSLDMTVLQRQFLTSTTPKNNIYRGGP